jgi:hypothetical protein
MIHRSKQSWAVGATVKVGFMGGLTVKGIRQVKDGLPDYYLLEAANGKHYQFVPHNGLELLKEAVYCTELAAAIR